MSTAASTHPARPVPAGAVRRAPLASLGMCVVDLETTGGAPGRSRITEIGAVRLRGLRPVARFSTLVDPGCPIPPVVRDITGIDDEMVAGAPAIDEALGRFAEFAGDDVLVAHNAPFDLRFLNYERRRLHGRYFEQPFIDTLSAARALLRGRVERHDLASLAAWAGTRVRPAHRALPDAEATAELLAQLLALGRRRGIATLDDLDALAAPEAAAYTPKLALCEELPACAGIYILRDGDGRALHMSPAANLRRDARRLIAPGARRSRALAAAVDAAVHVDHEVHGSRLGALLRSGELAGRLDPGVAGAPAAGVRYLVPADGPGGLRVAVVPGRHGEAASAYGPVRGERRARRAAECLAAAFGDGDGATPPVEAVGALLAGDARALDALDGRLRRARARGRLDPRTPAGRRLVDDLMAVLAQLALARRARARVAVLVERGPRPGTAEAFFVAGGALLHRAVAEPDDWVQAVRDGLARLRSAPVPAPPIAPEREACARLVEDRLAERGGHPAAVRLEDGWETEPALRAVGAAIAATCAPAAGRRSPPGD